MPALVRRVCWHLGLPDPLQDLTARRGGAGDGDGGYGGARQHPAGGRRPAAAARRAQPGLARVPRRAAVAAARGPRAGALADLRLPAAPAVPARLPALRHRAAAAGRRRQPPLAVALPRHRPGRRAGDQLGPHPRRSRTRSPRSGSAAPADRSRTASTRAPAGASAATSGGCSTRCPTTSPCRPGRWRPCASTAATGTARDWADAVARLLEPAGAGRRLSRGPAARPAAGASSSPRRTPPASETTRRAGQVVAPRPGGQLRRRCRPSPSAASRAGSRVATVTAPPRSKATTCSAGRAGRRPPAGSR